MTKVRIRVGDDPQKFPEVDFKKAERIMTALAVIIEAVEDTQIEERAVTSEVLAALYDHARNPELRIDARLVEAIEKVGLGALRGSGTTPCSVLFGAGYKQKLQEHGSVTMVDDDVRAVIVAARPKVHITFRHPYDIHDETTQHRERVTKESDRRRQHDLGVTQVESGDGVIPFPDEPGRYWRELVREHGQEYVNEAIHTAKARGGIRQ